MSEEYLYEREEELLDYIRNNLTDSLTTRGTDTSDSLTATGGTNEEFTLTKVLVKNVISVVKASTTLTRGEDYSVTYGEDGEDAPYDKTKVTIYTTTVGEAVVISYHYGDCYVHEGFSVDGKLLPLCFMQQLTANTEFTGIGEGFDSGYSQWINGRYVFEIRDKYKRRCKKQAHKAFNLIAKFRHANPFRLRNITSENLSNMEYSKEKKAWSFQFIIVATWEVPFQ